MVKCFSEGWYGGLLVNIAASHVYLFIFPDPSTLFGVGIFSLCFCGFALGSRVTTHSPQSFSQVDWCLSAACDGPASSPG